MWNVRIEKLEIGAAQPQPVDKSSRRQNSYPMRKLRPETFRSARCFSRSYFCAARGPAAFLLIPTTMAVYPEYMVAPIRQDLTEVGFEQLMTPEAVDSALASSEGTVLVAVNSVCGCAAAKARPALKMALASADKKPGKLVTVFAGMETDAVAKMREHLLPYPPSSPCIALFKDGELVHMIERYHIEGSDAMRIVNNLQGAFEEYC